MNLLKTTPGDLACWALMLALLAPMMPVESRADQFPNRPVT